MLMPFDFARMAKELIKEVPINFQEKALKEFEYAIRSYRDTTTVDDYNNLQNELEIVETELDNLKDKVYDLKEEIKELKSTKT